MEILVREDGKPQIKRPCDKCNMLLIQGQGHYEGRIIADWSMVLCDGCSAYDGVVPDPEFVAKLKSKGFKAVKDKRGLIPIP